MPGRIGKTCAINICDADFTIIGAGQTGEYVNRGCLTGTIRA
jgi:hypothetical protein